MQELCCFESKQPKFINHKIYDMNQIFFKFPKFFILKLEVNMEKIT